MHPLINKKINEVFLFIHPENNQTPFDDEVFHKVDELIELTGTQNIASLVYVNAPKNNLKLSILFDILIWSTADNGSELLRETYKWFLEDDELRLNLILNMKDVYPYQPFDVLKKRLLDIRDKFPQLNDKCDYWLKAIEEKI